MKTGAVRAQRGQEAAPVGRPEGMATTKELAVHLQVPPHTLEQWRSQGKGPDYHKVGRHVRYEWRDVFRWKDGQKMTLTA
jgi:hypothetical protein